MTFEDLFRCSLFLGYAAIASDQAFTQTNNSFVDMWNSYKTPELSYVEEIPSVEENKYQAVLDNLNKANNKDNKEKFSENELGVLYRGFIWMPLCPEVGGSDNTQYANSIIKQDAIIRQHNQKRF